MQQGEVTPMDYGVSMTRNDIHAGVTCNRNSMRILQGKKSRCKVVIGDQTGSATVFSVGKHNELKLEFKTVEMPKPVGVLDIYTDQVFVATGSRINAYTRKGRPFFGLETNMAETINTLQIDTPYLFAGGDFVLTMFNESKELGFFLSPDRINSLLLRKVGGESEEGVYDLYLACQDRMLRSVRNTVKTGEVICESPLLSLQYHETAIVYGTVGGSFGGFALNQDNQPVRMFSVIPSKRIGGITTIACSDITRTGKPDIVIGRDDGSVEVHIVDRSEDGAPKKIWEGNVAECVNSVDCGMVTQTVRDEVLVHTYSGKVVSFVAVEDGSRPVVPQVLTAPQQPVDAGTGKKPKAAQSPTESGAAPQGEVLKSKIDQTTQEIRMLKEELARTKQQLEQMAGGVAAGLPSEVPTHAPLASFSLRDKTMVDDTGALVLQLETNNLLDSVAIQSDVSLEVLDVEAPGSNVVISLAGQSPDDTATKTIAVFKVSEEGASMIIIRFRSTEGQRGRIRAFVIPRAQPRTSQMRDYAVRPLSLHYRCTENDVSPAAVYSTTLRIHGQFSLRDMHNWIFQCLPEVPESCTSEEGKLFFMNSFAGTTLAMTYRKGESEFMSENLSTLSILKECVTREATLRKIPVRSAMEMNSDSLPRHLMKLHPKIESQTRLAREIKLIEGLREIQSQESSMDFLTEELQAILKRAPEIEKEHREQPKHLEYLHRVLLRLFQDRAMFEGRSATQSLERQLTQLLADYNAQKLMEFFRGR